MLLEDLQHPHRALDVGEDGHRSSEAQLVPERSRQVDDRRLGVIDEYELTDAESGEARTQLEADRSSGAGDEDGRAFQVLAESGAADVDRLTPEQRLDRDVLGTHVAVSGAYMGTELGGTGPAPAVGIAADGR
jgi:hypothetical protein